VVDGSGEALPAGTAIRIDGATIVAVGPPASLDPASADSVRLAGATILPGMIDCHGYLSVDPDRPDPMAGMHGEDLVARAWLAARHLAIDLRSGVTTLRVMGEGRGLDFRARQAVAEGIIPGPSLLCSGTPVCPSSSHQAAPGGGADGVEGVRAAVRRAVAAGADWIKLVVTGGINAAGERATAALYTEAEIATGIAEAKAAGLPVAVAAHGGPAVAQAVIHGARTVEHCALFDEAALAVAAAHDATLVLTLSRFFLPTGIERSGRDVPGVPARLSRAREHLAALVPQALARGARIALGTDNMHGALATDVRLLTELGASNAQALHAATGAAARAMGVDTAVGRLARGMRADMLVVDGDPLADIAAIGRVRAVIAGGRVVHGALA
jgi:imidazolonepropionase-like amidohydrolase